MGILFPAAMMTVTPTEQRMMIFFTDAAKQGFGNKRK